MMGRVPEIRVILEDTWSNVMGRTQVKQGFSSILPKILLKVPSRRTMYTLKNHQIWPTFAWRGEMKKMKILLQSIFRDFLGVYPKTRFDRVPKHHITLFIHYLHKTKNYIQ